MSMTAYVHTTPDAVYDVRWTERYKGDPDPYVVVKIEQDGNGVALFLGHGEQQGLEQVTILRDHLDRLIAEHTLRHAAEAVPA